MSEPLNSDDAHLQVEQIDGLIAAAGVDGAQQILDAFWRSTTELVDTLADQVRQNALDLASQTAHAVKGSAANVGAQRLAQTASRFEEACRRGDADAVEVALADVKADFAAVRVHFDTHLAQKS
ncbi:MAG: Hpt domain-containing protein [Hyphococcus sp.]